MEEKKDPDKKIKGLHILISSMRLHYISGLRTYLPYNLLVRPNIDEIRARTKGLETDLNSVGEAVEKILTIAKKKGYEEVRKVIEDEMYRNGFEQRFRQT